MSEKPLLATNCSAGVSEPGYLWLLGPHRLLCGDSTSLTDLEQLMRSEKADLAFLDPPYNVRYTGHKKSYVAMQKDQLSAEQYTAFLNQLLLSHKHASKRGASLYLCHASLHQRDIQDALEANGWIIRSQIIWAKHQSVMNFGRYKYQHEVIFYCYQDKANDLWYGDNKQTTLWQIPKAVKNAWHPTMKPVALIEKILKNSSKKDDQVLDLCAGSGSTLIACEKLGRVARLMEIDPRYVATTVERWEKYTKQKAVLWVPEDHRNQASA